MSSHGLVLFFHVSIYYRDENLHATFISARYINVEWPKFALINVPLNTRVIMELQYEQQ